MNKAAENVYTAIRRDGSQAGVVATMQTRAELYDRIGYHAFEARLDALFARGSGGSGSASSAPGTGHEDGEGACPRWASVGDLGGTRTGERRRALGCSLVEFGLPCAVDRWNRR